VTHSSVISQVARVSSPSGPAASSSRRTRARRDAALALLFVLPCVGLFVAFRFGPALAGAALSLFDYSITGSSEWKGLGNYRRLVDDPLFWNSLRVTLMFTVLTVPTSLVVSTGMALLVRRTFRGVALYRSVFFLPVVTSLVLAGVVFTWIFSADGLPQVLAAVGLPGNSWLASSVLVLPAISLVVVWNRFGYGMLILLARMQDLPRETEEAALTDGANAWQRFRYVVFPELKPALFFVAVIETVFSFQIFDAIYVMTGGGPVHASYSLVYMLYDQGFKYFDLGYAAAIGMILFVLTLVVALVQRRLFGRES
jgi:multiple sugar transport system permease protein